ncbi:extensin-like domain-containing protein [Shimia sp. Alg240-R146]|uniref:extensin-like domain-containing protein n=1 Tax=Shimia sp. Alg240-R146 TaxID=2993449 RepID=UPI0022E673CB|nr:extensin family protein [Shimia sp. Alg240-R146]
MTLRGVIGLTLATALTALGGIAVAKAPKTSLRPVTREHVYPVALTALAPEQSLRPKLRPARIERVGEKSSQAAPTAAAVPAAKPTSKRATSNVTQTAMASGRDAAENGTTTQRKRNKRLPEGMSYLCKSRNIIGTAHAPVPGKLAGCGIKSGAIKVYQVSDVSLSTPAVMTCDTAFALQRWVDEGVADAVKHFGGGVAKLKVAAGYSCRTRNNRKGGKISEHGKGKAIDISALYTKSGEEISVLNDWGKGSKGRMLREMHRSACGPFGTVLGPNADRHHRDHFHFDVARHRGGPYCR